MNYLALIKWTKENSRLLGAILVMVLCFSAGWWGHKRFTKSVTTTVNVPVYIQNPEQPEHKVEDTVEPAHHTVSNANMPVAPSDPLENPQATTVIEVPVLVPQLVKVFHQNRLSFSEQKDGYSVWVDGRVWATGEDGKTLSGVHAQTLFNRDAELFIPRTIKIPKEHPWAVGGIVGVDNVGRMGYGLFVDYDLAFSRLGIEVFSSKTDTGYRQTSIMAKAGVRF